MAQPPLELFLITLAQSQDDVVLEGVDADRRPARLVVSGFRPHFYVGPVADDVDATNRQADLCRAAPAHAVSVTKVTRTFLCGIHEPRTYLRVAHRCGAAQSTLVRKCEQLWAEPPCEDGVPLLRRFLVETHLSGGAWLVARNGRQWICRRKEGQQQRVNNARRWSDADKSSKDSIAAVALATSDGVDVLAVGGRGEALLACGARVSLFRDESRLLAAVETHLRNADPDVLFTFDDRRLGLLAQRFRARHRRALQLGRFDATPLACASVTTYSKAWIKDRSERRMASANNLETHRCSGLGGRLGVDLLRCLVMRQQPKLTRYDLPEACRAVLDAAPPTITPAARQQLDASTRAAVAACEARAILALGRRLNAVAETVEYARCTGLDLETILWRATAVRTEQLVLGAAKRLDVALPLKRFPAENGWVQDTTPFLHHPAPRSELRDHQAALISNGLMGHSRAVGSCGFYGKDPVVVLDFASLYPSLFVAHNICWTTLRGAGAEADDAVCPASAQLKHPHRFASKTKRPGLLPRLLEALITTRRRTKALAKAAAQRGDTNEAEQARQLSLKLCANASYGFTGSDVSPLGGKAPPSCVRWGNWYCRRARDVIEAEVEGAEIAAAASAALPEGLTLEHEHTLCPFLLLHVNRYAGRDFGGEVVIKGIGSARGDTDFVRATLRDSTTALLERGVEAACALAAARQEQLLRGDVALDELVSGAYLWRVDQSDLERFARGEDEDDSTLRTPHVALATKRLKQDPGLRFRLGEFVPMVHGKSLRGDAQKDGVMDPPSVLKTNAAVDLKLYRDKKLLPDLRRLFAPFAQRADVKKLLDEPPSIVRSGKLSCDGASVLLDGSAAPPSPTRQRPDRFFLAQPRAEALCVNCSSRTEDADRKAAFCRSCLRLPLADRQAAFLKALAEQREAHASVAVVAAERVEAARRCAGAAPGSFPVADGAYALARAIQRLEKADAACERDFCRAPASLRPPPAPRKKKRTRAPARDLAGARRTLGFGDSDEEVDSWTCRECAYPHTSPAEAAMVACAACGERRPSRAKKQAPPATPSAVLMRGGRSPPPRTPGRVARSPAPRTPALASPAPPQTPAVTYGGRPARRRRRAGAPPTPGGPPPPETPETKQPPSVVPVPVLWFVVDAVAANSARKRGAGLGFSPLR
ncbi:unnamed protein product [Pelagomonas calceolata]|uniref:DNA-directed DNA polymerase n=1 Tax=Pelagomonas calceolata TaxID=35677 RepID=A0A8J2X194_9STRA|nr:unnamed protein product [Pelagomonas calceolata]